MNKSNFWLVLLVALGLIAVAFYFAVAEGPLTW
jgi:hypothetical protein